MCEGLDPKSQVLQYVQALRPISDDLCYFPMQRRVFLHRPLQLASVLFAAASTGGLCARAFESTASPGCWGLVSCVQLTIGVIVPHLLVFCLDVRTAWKSLRPVGGAAVSVLQSL